MYEEYIKDRDQVNVIRGNIISEPIITEDYPQIYTHHYFCISFKSAKDLHSTVLIIYDENCNLYFGNTIYCLFF